MQFISAKCYNLNDPACKNAGQRTSRRLAEASKRGAAALAPVGFDRLTYRPEGAWEESCPRQQQAILGPSGTLMPERLTAIPMSLATANLPTMRRMS
ncbi:hypothetical protein MESS2_400009 [Mesorhizobium metallidurans STM 2683]|uniref:Uncharacterized protein n=1 Tax=Mesorhizobium metallidurans STM 2683 TaxID=1297569 RepID=M5ES14_9HYPH|nr:hypothetical protein MESS2_400009 [Mesorhizobium metallidurans STM 2683]